MKNILWLPLLFLLANLHGQIHEVVYVKGTVKAPKTNQLLKKGSTFSARYKDQLSFMGKQDFLITLEQSKKRNYVVRPHPNQDKVLLQLIPYRVKNRPGYILSGVDLVNYLNEGGNYLVIGKSTYIPINPREFAMNQDTFFYLRYNYWGESINKKLPISKEGLLLHRDSLFQARFTLEEYYRQILKDKETIIPHPKQDINIQISPDSITSVHYRYIDVQNFKFDTITYITNVALYHRDGKNQQNIKIDAPSNPNNNSTQLRPFLPFNLVFLDDKRIEKMIFPLIESGFFNSDVELVERVTAFLEEQFEGKLAEENVKQWLEDRN